MGVDWYPCDNCGETFPDCGEYMYCEHGHRIGPCCYPNGRRSWPEEQLLEDHDDYGTCVKAAFCPVCKAGGTAEEKLKEFQWVDCDDRLPKPDVEVLGFYRESRVSVFSLSGGLWYDAEDKPLSAFGDITHWMPLPAPPRLP